MAAQRQSVDGVRVPPATVTTSLLVYVASVHALSSMLAPILDEKDRIAVQHMNPPEGATMVCAEPHPRDESL